MSYLKYPEYRDSGVEWLGGIPSHWMRGRTKNMATINATKAEVANLSADTAVSFIPMEAIGENGELDVHRTRRLSDVCSGYTYIRDGDVITAKITPCFENGKGCVVSGLTNGIGFATTEVIPLRPSLRTSLRFLYFLLHSEPFRKVAEGSMYGAGGQKRVSDSFVSEYHLAIPPLPEQRQIATFLDRECAAMNALMAKQKRLIALLKEKRQALISHTVTKGLPPAAATQAGLDPHPELKDSGIEWLGEVPEGWVALSFSRILAKIEQGYSPNSIASPPDSDETGLLKISAIKKGRFIEAESKTVPEEVDVSGQPIVKVGDLLVTRANTRSLVADSAIVKKLRHNRLMLSDLTYRLVFNKKRTCGDFLNFVLLSNPLRWQIEMDARGSSMTMAKVSQEHIRCWKLALPPLPEQRAIVAYLDETCGKIDTLIAKAESAINLLAERRTALISAAVTGKIDVRNPPPP